MIELGRVCLKTAGRETGKCCVVVNKIDDKFVLVTGPKSLTKVKRRRCNVEHLRPLEHRISIKADAKDSEVEQLMKKEKVLQKIDVPVRELVKESKEPEAKAEAEAGPEAKAAGKKPAAKAAKKKKDAKK